MRGLGDGRRGEGGIYEATSERHVYKIHPVFDRLYIKQHAKEISKDKHATSSDAETIECGGALGFARFCSLYVI